MIKRIEALENKGSDDFVKSMLVNIDSSMIGINIKDILFTSYSGMANRVFSRSIYGPSLNGKTINIIVNNESSKNTYSYYYYQVDNLVCAHSENNLGAFLSEWRSTSIGSVPTKTTKTLTYTLGVLDYNYVVSIVAENTNAISMINSIIIN